MHQMHHQMHQMHHPHSHPDPDHDYEYDLDPEPEPPRRKSHRRRPELNINTIISASASDPPGLTTPLSPPPPPQLPYKSSSRSLRSSAAAAAASSSTTVTIAADPTSPYSYSSSSRRHPPVSSKGKQAAAYHRYASSSSSPPSAKFPAQAYGAYERDARHADPESGTYDPDFDWAKNNHRGFETFLDPLSPDDMSNKENDFPAEYDRDRDHHTTASTPPSRPQPRPRDSHDLSLSPRNVTRDSLLGNMLLSLDQFSMGQMNCAQGGGAQRTMSGFAEESNYYDDDAPVAAAASRTMTSTSRAPRRGHGHSYSSDYEDNSSTLSRGQRSNSSSTGFQSNLGRINSMREMSSHRNTNGAPGSRPLHSRGGRGSKSSSTNSIDAGGGGYAQVLGSQRWAHGLGSKRSSSFELARRPSFGVQADQHQQHYHQQHQPQQQQQQQNQRRPWQLELSESFAGDDYDAAPTPTVPVGPRRLPNMPSMPSFHRAEPMGEPLSPVRSINLERKRSNKSSRSTNTSRQGQSRFNHRDAPPVPTPAPQPASVPTPELDAAPAPHVGYEKAKEPVHQPAQNSVPQPKERPGFFKRMFGGGSKNSVVAALDQSANSSVVSNSSNNSTPLTSAMGSNNSNQVSSSQPKSGSNPPSRGSQNHSSHGLQKKPSSFFRRRKKSVSVADAELPRVPPLLAAPTISPVQLPPAPSQRLEVLTPRAQPSPVTSLRKAMDPYLTHSGSSSGLATPRQPPDDLSPVHLSEAGTNNRAMDRTVRSFSPDYEPDPMATIRSVPSESRGRDAGASAGEAQRRTTTPLGEEPPRPLYNYERTGSFLHDNSESEESPPRVRKPDPQLVANGHPRSPNDVGRASLAPLQTNQPMSSTSLNTTRDKKMDRLTQDSLSTIKSERHTSLQLPIEGALTDPKLNTRASAASIPSLMVEDSEPNSKVTTPKPDNPLDEPFFVVGDPTEDDRAKAQKIYDGNEEFIPKDKAASWMGEEGLIRQRVLQAYMDLYDFKSKNIVTSLRDVCNRLILRAETQQVDRILVAFSSRWCNCNPNHGFKSTDVIHTICYSIMLLNTDLHMADIEQKMTRSQFIKNTMTTIIQALGESVPEMFNKRGSVLPGKGLNLDDGDGHVEHERSSFRNSFVKFPMRAGSALGDAPTELDDCGPLVKAPFEGSLKAWESQMEQVLKDTYASIRDERLPLFGAEQPPQEQQPSGGLSVMGMLKRSPSVLSKAPSENPSTRGRVPDSMRASNSRWSSKSRSRPRGFGSAGFSSSRTSFDDGQSMWSPVESNATWSRASLGRTQTSMSMDSFGSHFTRGGGYQQSIGFANALSQAIIREDPVGSVQSLVSDELKPTQLLDDESLELAGPPWVKEGMVVHKHHLDGVDKKAKERNWSEVFAVIQKGTISIFSFTPNKSTARRGRNAQNIKKGAVVGGGNWQENATSLGSWSLRLALASTLPPPGYSKQRPHVWALSLPTGAVHLFHVGTPEICKEFVTTANYWSARLSTHPLIGGVSNMEYGWSDSIINNALVTAINENTGSTTASSTAGRQRSNSAVGRSSMHSRGSSFRSVGSFDFGSSSIRGDSSNKLPGDRITISEWMPPTQSMRPSNSPEKEQLETLLKYVKSIEDELQQHNSLRSPMLLAFSPRGPNVQKAMANWERKSSYLLREIVKFRTYVDCLQHAEVRKAEIWREREVARRAARGSLDLEDDANDVDGHRISRRDWDDGGSDRGHPDSIYEMGDEPVMEEGDQDATLRARS
ncbi:hypothetical protein J7T55_000343 [Diaporthe amygdali]|uniref:uncharacterized protein n=1 Tax=Phomopsis amygdali TaxID=1214568 RepID=UPI0022FE1380|nr:uncharacterized protein J7T55_000343 [Diaporthe amygdali]KAJ0109418.1 hypothetical protein J7T55_000343 [Diaporthe amygdali]